MGQARVPAGRGGMPRPSWHLPHAKVCAPPRARDTGGQGVGGDADVAWPQLE